MECISHVFCRDAIPALGIDKKGASENVEFGHCREDDSERCISPIWGCRHVSGKLVLMSPTGCGVISNVGLLGDLGYLG